MSRADHAYHMRGADEGLASVERSETLEARAGHRQLRNLCLVRVGLPVTDQGFTVHAVEHA